MSTRHAAGTSTPGRSLPPSARGRDGAPWRGPGCIRSSAGDTGSARTTADWFAACTREPPPRSRRARRPRGASSRRNEVAHHGAHERVELLDRADVLVRVIRTGDLLTIVEQARLAVVDRDLRAGAPQLARRRDHDHLVEPFIAAGLVEERHLGDADLGSIRKGRELLAPPQVLR